MQPDFSEIQKLREHGNVIPVPMDFDFSGVVNARYATPDPKINITRVRERLFRGYCVPAEEFTKVFEQFRQGKAPIYALYDDTIGKLMRKDYKEVYVDLNAACDVVGITAMGPQIKRAYDLADHFRARGCRVVLARHRPRRPVVLRR